MIKMNGRKLLNETMQLYRLLPWYESITNHDAAIAIESISAGIPVTIISMRTAIFTGKRPMKATFDCPIRRVKLSDVDGTWMTTDLQELSQLSAHVRVLRDRQRVLVGGLGLGVIAHLLAVQGVHVTVVESSRTIVDLVKPFLDPSIEVVISDLFEFLRDVRRGQYDAAYYDIWRGTGEWIWQTQVVPLRRLSAGRVKPVYCWQEDEMIGQVFGNLFRCADASPESLEGSSSLQHYWAWRKGIERMHPSTRIGEGQDANLMLEIERENRSDPYLQRAASLFLRSAGSARWEAMFGKWWDESLRLAEEKKSRENDASVSVQGLFQ